MPNLNERFLGLWHRIGATGDPNVPFTDLLSRYAEPWRAYHTIRHIESMLCGLDDAMRMASCMDELVDIDDVPAIRMAIWYHDVIYDPKKKLNEEMSTEHFRLVAESSRISPEFINSVVRMILATKHSLLGKDHDLSTATLCDLDLAILGQSEEVFDEYEQQIRTEYNWVADEEFRKGRTAILRLFLDRPTIYETSFFRRRYEKQARANLVRSCDRLATR